MKKALIKLPRNRVRRNYLGGAGIDRLHGEPVCVDNDRPEEWLGSMVEAVNPGMDVIEHEGLIQVDTDEGKRYLRDVVDGEKEYYLGDCMRKDGSWQLSFLYKILDSSMRLHIQAHPTSDFARSVMGKRYGKLECYYILRVREDIEPYIYLGFQHSPSREEWKDIIETQDKERMEACFEKISVKPGEVWYIPGGMPHAIGEGITLLEIMEPSDLVVRCEFEREGIIVPKEGRFMGRDIDFCLDIFDYNEYSKEDIVRKCKVSPVVLKDNPEYKELLLINETFTPCFYVGKIEVMKDSVISHHGRFTIGLVTRGECVMEADGCRMALRQGDSFAIAASVQNYKVDVEDGAELCMVYPGNDMKMDI